MVLQNIKAEYLFIRVRPDNIQKLNTFRYGEHQRIFDLLIKYNGGDIEFKLNPDLTDTEDYKVYTITVILDNPEDRSDIIKKFNLSQRSVNVFISLIKNHDLGDFL